MEQIDKNNRTLALGDIHGNYKALKQCLERSKFDKENDTLIFLGDIADGWHEVYECVEELLSIKNLVALKGNHDEWFNQYLQFGFHPAQGEQGSQASIDSYNIDMRIANEKHIKFFYTQLNYYIDEKNRCFVHGGFNRHSLISEQREMIYYWDRDLWSQALSYEAMTSENKPSFKTKDNFSEIFIGHTSTQFWNKNEPMKAANIWNLDTGAGFLGKLSIMDVDTHEFWQSDTGDILYPGLKGR